MTLFSWHFQREGSELLKVLRTGFEPVTQSLEGCCSIVNNIYYASIYVAETVVIRRNYGNIIQKS